MPSNTVACNTRILMLPLAGVQRYLTELLSRLPADIDRLAPATRITGIKAHMWDQFVLPRRVGRRVLWSPSNAGPLSVGRQVLTIHDMVPFDHPEWIGRSNGAWYRTMQMPLARRVRHILTVSEFTKRRLIALSGVAPEKITVTPLAAAGGFRPHAPDDIARTRQALGLPSPRYVLSNCTLEPRKNLNGLLAAWTQALPSLPDDLWLCVSGAVGAAATFGDQVMPVHLPPRVTLLGRVPDDHLTALLAGAEFFVYVSFYEGFGIPPLEAMASGVPVIASNAASIPEVTGDAALLVDPGDTGAISAAIIAHAEDDELRRRHAAAGLARAGQFSWDRCAAQTWAVLEKTAAGEDTAAG